MEGGTPQNSVGEEEKTTMDEAREEAAEVEDEGKIEPENAPFSEESVDEAEVADETAANDDAADTAVQSDNIDRLLDCQTQLLERIDALNALFKERILHTDYEEKIVDQMHKELQRYKEDMYAQLVRPILLDVIEVRDSILRMAAAYLSKPEGEQAIPNKTFADYSYDLQDILEKNAVEIYRSKTGDDFTPIKQKAIKKIATNDEALHGKVAESLSCGYCYNGRILSAERVTVYFFDNTIKENEKSEVVENG